MSKSLYSDRANERRRQFNNIINGIDMVLMNNIPEVDPSVWDNWQAESPMAQECDIVPNPDKDVDTDYWCNTHEYHTNNECECEEYESDGAEVYQWFAVGDTDADFLKRHGQYITYSDKLDTYFLAICHCGTGWDYVDSMVDAFSDMYHGLDKFSDEEK